MRTFVHVQSFFFGPAFSSDHRRLPTITAFTSFHTTLFWRYTSDQRHRTLNRTLWCDGAFKEALSFSVLPPTHTAHVYQPTNYSPTVSLCVCVCVCVCVSVCVRV